ncbi:hypothetical protein VKT23_008293 [Stygiomarasmius scandens]|uniref:Hypervirulence associated protein TUDOR domain-containing protein n=1 Tax=Marasmiellus scandens TaxID=2682957 RepID=A0ABR1JKK7_9AGAR
MPQQQASDAAYTEYEACIITATIGGGNVPKSSTTGEITDVVETKAPAGDANVKVNATEEEPRYVIRNDNTGKETAYKAKNITGLDETE